MATGPPAKVKDGRQSALVMGAAAGVRNEVGMGEDEGVCQSDGGWKELEKRVQARHLAETLQDAHCVPGQTLRLQSAVEKSDL